MAFNSWLFVLVHDGYPLPFVVRIILNFCGDISDNSILTPFCLIPITTSSEFPEVSALKYLETGYEKMVTTSTGNNIIRSQDNR